LLGSSIEQAMKLLPKATLAALRIAARSPAVSAASRSADKLDIMVARPDGVVVTTAWEPGDKAWRGWWTIADLRTTAGAPITAVVRSKDHLDAFAVASGGHVISAAWQPGDKAWRGWWRIADMKTLPGTAIGAVSRSADKLDVSVTGLDGII
jgi:hypothetical protein